MALYFIGFGGLRVEWYVGNLALECVGGGYLLFLGVAVSGYLSIFK